MDFSEKVDEKVQPKVANGQSESLSTTNAESDDLAMLALEKRVLRKTDMVVLPMMCFVFFFQCKQHHLLSSFQILNKATDLDKQSLSYASVYGLITDLDLKGNQFSWTSSIFYVGQLASEFPFIYLMSRFKLSKFVGITM